MKDELEKLINAEVGELNAIIEGQLKIPDAIFRKHGLSCFMVLVLEKLGSEYSQELEQYRQSFDELCTFAPNVSRDAICFVCLAYALLVVNLRPRKPNYSGDLEVVKSLIAVSSARYFAMGIIASDPNSTEKDRRLMLSKAGSLGVKVRNEPFELLRTWVLKNMNEKMPKTRETALKLLKILPQELVKVSVNPERFIHGVLCELKK